jgi:transposase
VAKDFC